MRSKNFKIYKIWQQNLKSRTHPICVERPAYVEIPEKRRISLVFDLVTKVLLECYLSAARVF